MDRQAQTYGQTYEQTDTDLWTDKHRPMDGQTDINPWTDRHADTDLSGYVTDRSFCL